MSPVCAGCCLHHRTLVRVEITGRHGGKDTFFILRQPTTSHYSNIFPNKLDRMDETNKVHVSIIILKPIMDGQPPSADILFQRASGPNLARFPFVRESKSSFDMKIQAMTRNGAVLSKALSVANKFFGQGECSGLPKESLDIPGQDDETLLPPGLVMAWNQPDRFEIIEVPRTVTNPGDGAVSLSDYYVVYLLDAEDDDAFIAEWKPRAAINMRQYVDDGHTDHGCFWKTLRPDILTHGGLVLTPPTKHFLKHHIDALLSARATLMRNMALRRLPNVNDAPDAPNAPINQQTPPPPPPPLQLEDVRPLFK